MAEQTGHVQLFGEAPFGVLCRERTAAYAVIRDDIGRVAAVSPNILDRDALWLPGGGCLPGETPEETVRREIREELARDVCLVGRIGSAIQFFFAGDEQIWYRMSTEFFAGTLQGWGDTTAEYELLRVDPRQQQDKFYHECHAWAAVQTFGVRSY